MQNEPREFEALVSKKKITRRMTVNYISFSAHVDFQQNSDFIDQVKPTHLILVHGSRDNMFRLRDALKGKYKDKQQDVQIYTPSNVRDKIRIQLSGTRIAKVAFLPLTIHLELADTDSQGYWIFSRASSKPR